MDCLLTQVYNRLIKAKYIISRHFLEASMCLECIVDIFIAKNWPNRKKIRTHLELNGQVLRIPHIICVNLVYSSFFSPKIEGDIDPSVKK